MAYGMARSAIAIQTTMLGAGAAGFFQALPQRLTSPVQADHEVVRGDADGFGHCDLLFSIKVNAVDEVGILGFEGGEESAHAGAHFPHQFGIGCGMAFFTDDLQVLKKGIVLAPFSRSGAVKVDERIAKDAIEPCGGFFHVGHFA